jgi:hypothetical protein
MQALHRVRERLVSQRTSIINHSNRGKAKATCSAFASEAARAEGSARASKGTPPPRAGSYVYSSTFLQGG